MFLVPLHTLDRGKVAVLFATGIIHDSKIGARLIHEARAPIFGEDARVVDGDDVTGVHGRSLTQRRPGVSPSPRVIELDGVSESKQVAVVTGASRGIGKGIALELGALGATVYVSGRTASAGGVSSS